MLEQHIKQQLIFTIQHSAEVYAGKSKHSLCPYQPVCRSFEMTCAILDIAMYQVYSQYICICSTLYNY